MNPLIERSDVARDSKEITQFYLPPTHEPYTYRIFKFYFPAAEHHRRLAGTYCVYPRRDGQAELACVAGYIQT